MQSVKQEPGRTNVVLAEIRENFNSRKRVTEETNSAVKRRKIAPGDVNGTDEVHTKSAATECPHLL